MRARGRFLLGLALVTVGAGIFAVAFRATLTALYHAVYGADNVVDSITGLRPPVRFAVPFLAAALAGVIARFGSTRSQGMSNVMEAIALGRVQLSLRATVSRVASSWIAIAGGLSIGREGPLIEVGGALGAAIGRTIRTSMNDTRVLVAAGTAAGFSAAYNTPFAATLFVVETIAGIAAPQLLLPVMAATVGATAITRAVVGAGPIYGQRAFGLESYVELLSFAALGIAAAVVAHAFKSVLEMFENWFEAHPVPQPFRAMFGGFAVGAIAIWLPSVVGNGYEPLNQILDRASTDPVDSSRDDSVKGAGRRVGVRDRTPQAWVGMGADTRREAGQEATRRRVVSPTSFGVATAASMQQYPGTVRLDRDRRGLSRAARVSEAGTSGTASSYRCGSTNGASPQGARSPGSS